MARRYLVFPGRHLVLTRFHETHLASLLRSTSLRGLPWRDAPPSPFFDDAEREEGQGSLLNHLILAVTSCNQPATCRFNPLPFHVRAIGADRFARHLREQTPHGGLRFSVLGIPHYRDSARFADFCVREMAEASDNHLRLTPENTVVLCGTASVLDLWAAEGFGTLPCELTQEPRDRQYPMDIVADMAGATTDHHGGGPRDDDGEEGRAGGQWGDRDKGGSEHHHLAERLSSATLSTFDDYPEVVARMVDIFREPLITDAGSLTEDRNYESYSYGMANPDILELKMKEVRPFLGSLVGAGRVVDEGCADGALLVRLAQEVPDACLLGVDLSSEFLAMCAERQRRGDFGGSFVHFHQRNLLNPIFADQSIDLTLCNSTTHEIWSYATQASGLREYLRIKHRQTRRGGKLVIRDVVGPAGPDAGERQVILALRCDDGTPPPPAPATERPPGQVTGQRGEVIDGGVEDFPLSPSDMPIPATYGADASPRSTLQAYLEQLSTADRFRRFAEDFSAATEGRRAPFCFEEVVGGGGGEGGATTTLSHTTMVGEGGRWQSFRLSLQDAAEFMSKCDYTDNWASECQEEFAFWSFQQWEQEMEAAGWHVVEASHAYASQWQVDTRFEGRMQLLDAKTGDVLPWPNTNMVLVGERRV